MDPGNWGTALLGGSKFGYTLLWVVLLSNLMAQFLQVLCARLGLASGLDLAQACRAYYSKPTSFLLWILCEIAIIATDLAEVIGSAVALLLLFGIPLQVGVLITGLDVLVLLFLLNYGFRKIEAVIFGLVSIIFFCFFYELSLASPDWSQVGLGLVIPSMPTTEALVISLGILGATVMPHNLYLHSSIVKTREVGRDSASVRSAIRHNTVDTILALSLAFLVNGAILVLSAAVFGAAGIIVEELEQGHELLALALGGGSAMVFAIALLAAGQSSTITGTLAGQIVMEGFLNLKISPWIRRLGTRLLAIVPAIVLIRYGGGHNTVQLLVISQVVLSMQLPFAIFPLIRITGDRSKMGEFANSRLVSILGYAIGVLISALNVYLLVVTLGFGWVGVGAIALFLGFVLLPRIWRHAPSVSPR